MTLPSVLVGLAFVAVRMGAGPAPPREPPFDPGRLVGVGPGAQPAVIPAPATLLYVDDACGFCATELERWSGALRRAGAVDPPVVVVSPASDPGGSHVPVVLRRHMLHDADGSIARALGLTGVPYRADIDTLGLVRGVHLGLTPPARIDSLVASRTAGKESAP